MIERDFKKKGLEGGLEAKHLMRNIMTDYLYFDQTETAEKPGYERGVIEEAIVKTMKACYPEKF